MAPAEEPVEETKAIREEGSKDEPVESKTGDEPMPDLSTSHGDDWAQVKAQNAADNASYNTAG